MRRIVRLDESELEESFSHSSGPGGQHVNKVASRVTLRHVPTGLSVTVQESRSQAMNREIARERLIELINERRAQAERDARHVREKKKRSSRPRPRGVKERILKNKKRRSETKRQRARVSRDD